ncbi:Sec-independent protein translocase protein TatB [Aquamicrobium ahrensii]|uniref:Sec-independent protein translocase protein TatB n=1 Tax=Aquamicrobium ahrensii TaxID=469551 RepID=A0ABV2KGH2_9HYPH
MLDVGWSEMLVIAVVMIVVVGPKDLPQMLRTFGRMTTKMRGMANDFQRQFNEALKEAELDDVKKSVDSLRGLNPAAEIRKQLNPFEKAASDVKASLDDAAKPKATPVPEVTPAAADAPFPAMTDGSAPPAQAADVATKTARSPGKGTRKAAGKANDKAAAVKAPPAKAKAPPAKKASPKTAALKAPAAAGPKAGKPAAKSRSAGSASKTTRTPK